MSNEGCDFQAGGALEDVRSEPFAQGAFGVDALVGLCAAAEFARGQPVGLGDFSAGSADGLGEAEVGWSDGEGADVLKAAASSNRGGDGCSCSGCGGGVAPC